jgi:hypothetical protein
MQPCGATSGVLKSTTLRSKRKQSLKLLDSCGAEPPSLICWVDVGSCNQSNSSHATKAAKHVTHTSNSSTEMIVHSENA